jgi:hypothetical protein
MDSYSAGCVLQRGVANNTPPQDENILRSKENNKHRYASFK